MNPTPYKVMISAGEASGDMHAANLVYALKGMAPAVKISALGSDALKTAGAEILVDNRDIAVMGLVEIIRHYPHIKRVLKQLEARLRSHPPDLLILVDYVEFNLRLARTAKSLGIRVLFYVSPQIWAWRPKRIKKIGQCIDMMATIFPFEVRYYNDANIPARYVGHPLVGKVKASASRADLRERAGFSTSDKILALLPGSRRTEVTRLLPPFIEAARILASKYPDLKFILPVAPGLDRESIESRISDAGIQVTLMAPGENYDAMSMADAALAASGTATLEITMLGTPFCIAYIIAPLSYQIFRHLIRIPHIGLTNIVAGRGVVKEFIQNKATPENLANECERLLFLERYRIQLRQDLAAITELLGNREGSQQVAELALEMLEGRAPKTAHNKFIE